MSTLRTNNLQNPDSGDVNLQLTQDGGAVFVGLVTTSSLNVNGNVTIGGTITYEDVTNIDSVGVITARSGIDVTGGVITSDDYTITGISSSISDTAVDVFIYDTSKDSDGGAWRKRTTHTSWYNETLGTATRGTRREFPAVAVIVSQDGTLTIYDGDDPDLPMWMVFTDNTGSGNFGQATMLSSRTNSGGGNIFMINGKFVIGGKLAWHDAVTIIDFISDNAKKQMSNGTYYSTLNISQRETTGGYPNSVSTSSGAIVDNLINDVAMTVLPSAPIDSATGLPIPTIAVATDGGVSVIKDDGTVVDKATTSDPSYTVDWMSPSRLLMTAPLYYGIFDDPFVEESGGFLNGISDSAYYNGDGNGTSWNYPRPIANLVNSTAQRVIATDSRTIIAATNSGLNIHELSISSGTDNNDGMVAYATTSYNTGWMHGDIKGAFLSDTDTTNVTATELIDLTNGSIPAGNNAVVANITANQLDFQTTSESVGRYDTGTTLETGKQYFATLTISNYTGSGDLGVAAGGGFDSTFRYSANGTYTRSIVGDAANEIQLFYRNTNTATVGLQIHEAEYDRSVNQKGLGIYGTITKSPVAGSGATAAELVAYGGFNGSNYLRQPHNADLNVGTGDFYVMCWVKGNQLMLWHRIDSGSLDMRCEFPTSGGNANKPRFLMNNGGVSIDFFATIAFDTTTWHHCVWVKRGARGGELYIDGVLNNSATAGSDLNLNGTNSTFSIGNRADSPTEAFNGYVSLFRFGASAPSAEQIKKMYEDEKFLFQENAACTLYGSSDAVTALAYDEVTDRLHVGTSSGRSDFQGLRRINNTTTAVTTAISAHDEFIVEQ